jgi:hypothetical protein
MGCRVIKDWLVNLESKVLKEVLVLLELKVSKGL